MKLLPCVLALTAAAVLSGCGAVKKSETVSRQAAYQPDTQARIRLYGISGRQIIRPYRGQSCEQWRAKAGARAHTRFINGLPRRVRNLSIGMPASRLSLAADHDTGIMSRASYREFIVPAGKPLVLDGSFSYQLPADRSIGSHGGACRVALSFTPEAGRDYEAHFTDCTFTVLQLAQMPEALAGKPENPAAPRDVSPVSTEFCQKAATAI